MYRRRQMPHYPGQRQSKKSCRFLGGYLTFLAKLLECSAEQGRQVHGVDLTEGARLTPSLRFADGQKLVNKRKFMELKLFLPGSRGGSKKKN